MLVTESGMVTECKELQPAKALFPMLVTELGMVMDRKEPHCAKALFPMLVTESGMVTECKELQMKYLLLVDYQCYTL